jgi:hypothetical protein
MTLTNPSVSPMARALATPRKRSLPTDASSGKRARASASLSPKVATSGSVKTACGTSRPVHEMSSFRKTCR